LLQRNHSIIAITQEKIRLSNRLETYRGYAIWRSTKTVWRTNPISGHSWAENIPLSTMYISGPGACVSREFRSIATARAEIDYLIWSRALALAA
jgi:hypothetical protein